MSKPQLIMPATVNVRALAAVSKFAGVDETRYYLQGVKVEIEPRAVTYVATDGHVLFAHRIERLADESPDNDLVGEFIIPTAQCRAFKCKKDDDGDADLYGDVEEMVLRRGSCGAMFQPINGVFPNWRKIMPALPLAQGIAQIRGDLLVKFQKASEELGLGLPFIAHNGHDGPALVRFVTGHETVGVAMPFRSSDERMTPLPMWASEPFRQAAE